MNALALRVRCPVRFVCSHIGCRQVMPGEVAVGVNETEDQMLGMQPIAKGWVLLQDADQPEKYALFCEHHAWLARREANSNGRR